MGMALGAVSTCILAAIFDAEFSVGLEKFYTFLIPVIISLFVASLAVAGVLASIASQDAREEETRKRKLMAARAKLPFALSQASDIFLAGSRHAARLERTEETFVTTEIANRTVREMTLPTDVVQTFLEVIENHDRTDVANRLSGILREYQVHMSRWVNRINGDDANFIETEGDRRRRTVAWVYLMALNETLFEYARDSVRPEPVVEETLRGKIRFRLPEEFQPDQYKEETAYYVQHFHRRFSNSISPDALA
ncbi:hypothetical protein ACM25N_13510 [Roseovarius sp. C7]|uniref:hypothetical protein n=1 Tax=Roseovarius sp. C7 TaxID=3398643 RepID=UPI0039F6DD69